MKFRRFVALFAVIVVAAIVGFANLVVQAQSYKVRFVTKSLAVMPPRTGEGMRVTFNFTVENDGGPIRRVQIRVLQPCNARGEGRVFADLIGQVIKRGTNNYQVSGVFQAPTGDKNFVLIQLLDREKNEKAPPLITSSGVRQWLPVTFRLAPPVS
ncbi:MAG: hypothetical protein ACE15E_13770 [Acidobacteriota bacterium]